MEGREVREGVEEGVQDRVLSPESARRTLRRSHQLKLTSRWLGCATVSASRYLHLILTLGAFFSPPS